MGDPLRGSGHSRSPHILQKFISGMIQQAGTKSAIPLTSTRLKAGRECLPTPLRAQGPTGFALHPSFSQTSPFDSLVSRGICMTRQTTKQNWVWVMARGLSPPRAFTLTFNSNTVGSCEGFFYKEWLQVPPQPVRLTMLSLREDPWLSQKRQKEM